MDKAVVVEDLVQVISRKPVLNHINLEVNTGECFGIFGTRGSGKTSLLHAMAGVERFKSGHIEVLGYNVKKKQGFKKKMGLVTQESSLFRDLRTLENLDFISGLKKAASADVEKAIVDFELRDYLREPVNSLEAGVYQRVALACAMLNSPEILFLDEIIRDIDLYSRQLMVKRLQEFKEQGGTIVATFSTMEFSQYMDRIGWLEDNTLEVYSAAEARECWKNRKQALLQRAGENDA